MDAAVTFAVNWIGSQLINEASLLIGVEDQVRSLQDELKCMQRYIRDAENRQGEDGGDGQDSIFIAKIREIAFHAEDVVDIYILEVGSMSTFSKFGYFLCNCLKIHGIGKQITEIETDIKKASERLSRYERPGAKSSSQDQMRPRVNIRESYKHSEDDFIVGLDTDIRDLVYQITSHMESAWVVSIVGQGGIGKTTLAKKIYNHNNVANHFNVRAWVSISQQWSKTKVLLEILKQTRGIRDDERDSMPNWSDREIIEKIYNFLKEKQYLVVLDDAWEKKAWNDVSSALPRNKKSKIIITTRNYDIPPYADPNCIIYKSRLLTDEQGWELFCKLVSTDKGTRFENLGKEMTRKCGGLPLAIVILAGLLRNNNGLNKWELVNTTFNSKLRQVEGPSSYGISIHQMFQLSYSDLPHYSRPCFLYLAIFPEDYEIPTEMLIQMWIAEGFVDHQLEDEETLEDVAEQVLEELICRCMVQVVRRSYTGKVETCRVHDLTRDFCINKAKKQLFVEIFNPSNPISKHSRRVIIDRGFFEQLQYSNSRSVIRPGSYMKLQVDLLLICKKMKLLRVLNLWNIKTVDGILPKEIGDLIHLRYLGLRDTNIDSLPNSIINLRNLLTLDYQNGFSNHPKVPDVLWKMEKLRHLYLPENTFEYTKELRLDTLTGLQTFWGPELGPHMTNELRRLPPSLQKLQVMNVKEEEMIRALSESPCISAGRLHMLHLSWSCFELESMELLFEHCQSLQELELMGQIREGPSPLLFPRNVVVLTLQNSGFQLKSSIVAMGKLGCLKALHLEYNAYVGDRMVFDANTFPQLEEVSLHGLYNLMEWQVDVGAVPRLQKLGISGCYELNRLPPALRHLTTIEIDKGRCQNNFHEASNSKRR